MNSRSGLNARIKLQRPTGGVSCARGPWPVGSLVDSVEDVAMAHGQMVSFVEKMYTMMMMALTHGR